jgi:hypothetical protein
MAKKSFGELIRRGRGKEARLSLARRAGVPVELIKATEHGCAPSGRGVQLARITRYLRRLTEKAKRKAYDLLRVFTGFDPAKRKRSKKTKVHLGEPVLLMRKPNRRLRWVFCQS